MQPTEGARVGAQLGDSPPGCGKLLSATTLNNLSRGQREFPKLSLLPGIEVTQAPPFNPLLGTTDVFSRTPVKS